jgi:DNA-binding XRE family transcriptional regulator
MGSMLKQIREARGLTQEQLAERLNTTGVSVSRYEKEEQRLTLPLLRQLSGILNVSVAQIIGEEPFSGAPVMKDGELVGVMGVQKGAANLKSRPKPHQSGPSSSAVPEIDVRAGMGPGGLAAWDYEPDGDGRPCEVDHVLGMWELPPAYLRQELRINPGAGRIIEVQGDSMEPTLSPGDRVMVNTHDRTPSPPGVFALWDGLGVVVKRVEFIPNTDPLRFVISSDNTKHERYERTAEELNIIGRVVWFARRM